MNSPGWKGQFSFQFQRKAIPKNVQTTTQLHSSHTLVKYCLKFPKPDFSNMWMVNVQVFNLGLEKAEEPGNIANIQWIIEKAIEFQKNTYFCFTDYAKSLTVYITIKCGKFFKRWKYQTTRPASWETCVQVRKQQLELDMVHSLVPNKKGVHQSVYCHPAYLNYMQGTTWKPWAWGSTSWIKDCQEEYQ